MGVEKHLLRIATFVDLPRPPSSPCYLYLLSFSFVLSYCVYSLCTSGVSCAFDKWTRGTKEVEPGSDRTKQLTGRRRSDTEGSMGSMGSMEEGQREVQWKGQGQDKDKDEGLQSVLMEHLQEIGAAALEKGHPHGGDTLVDIKARMKFNKNNSKRETPYFFHPQSSIVSLHWPILCSYTHVLLQC